MGKRKTRVFVAKLEERLLRHSEKHKGYHKTVVIREFEIEGNNPYVETVKEIHNQN